MAKPKIGDYVTANLAGFKGTRQGVFVWDFGNDTIRVEGELASYLCEGPNEVAVVADKDVFSLKTKQHIQSVRQRLGLE